MVFVLVSPGPPRDVAANKTCKEITLNWQPPLNNGGMAIAHYIITVLSDGNQIHQENAEGGDRERTIVYDKFMPQTRYEVRLKARSAAGFGDYETVSVTTDEFCKYLM